MEQLEDITKVPGELEQAGKTARKAKNQYPEDFKTIFGLSTMNWVDVVSGAFLTGLFMIYLTDYAGIGALAATLGTILLVGGRFVDAIDDPLQGWIMDIAKPLKWGKYKPFIILSIILSALAVIMLFSIPTAVASNSVLVVIWVVFFYLMFDIGSSFFADNPLKQSLTNDPVIRSKITTWPRIIGTFVVIPMAFFIPIMTSINNNFGDMHKSFSILTLAFMIPAGLISLLGILLIREGRHIAVEQQEKISLREIAHMFKINKPWIVSTLASVFNGFVWTLVFATTTYYIKWAYSTDLTTGVVDSAKFGSLTMVLGIFQLFPTILMAAISPLLVKVFKGPLKVYALSMWLQVLGGTGLFVTMLLGVLNTSPVIFFVFLVTILLGAGLSFVPGTLIGIECMDYGMYKTGKEMHGIVNSVSRFIGKAQTALSSALIGAVLIAIGYQVNSVTDTFTGDLSAIPNMLRWFIIICGLLPAIFSLIGLFILRGYPITNAVRAEMNEAINRMKEAQTH
jgi:Na+/melibiose symporter-like transporter